MKRALARTIASLAPPRSAAGLRVLMYHAVDEPDAADVMALRVRPAHFRAQMTLLRDESYLVVPLATAIAVAPVDGLRRVAITFDDGYRSDTEAARVLREFGFDATFFVAPRFLDGVRGPAGYWEAWDHLRWDDASALARAGFDIGAHSVSHPDLRKCTGARLDEEVAGARSRLEERLGVPVLHFSYPFGRHDGRVRQAVATAGYRLACTSRYGLHRSSGPCMTVPRTEVTGRDDLATFRMKLQGRYDWVGYWQDVAPV